MTPDRQGLAGRPRPLEAVMTMTIVQGGHRSPKGIAGLFAVTDQETEAIRVLSGCVAELLGFQAAKGCFKSLTPAEVRAPIESGHPALRAADT